jgi:phosphocarrier protein HPr
VKLTCKVHVKNQMGLHTRPATTIVKLLQKCKSDVSFTHNRETVNAKSILSLLMLAARKNSRIIINVEGEDASTTMESLIEAFENQFGEKPCPYKKNKKKSS